MISHQVVAWLRKIICPEKDEENEVDDELNKEEMEEDEDTGVPESDNFDDWQYPYHKHMKLCVPTRRTRGKYVKVYGSYEYKKAPQKQLASKGVKKEKDSTKSLAKAKNHHPAGLNRFQSFSAKHDTCAKCDFTKGYSTVKIDVVETTTRVLVPNRREYGIVLQKLNKKEASAPDIDTEGSVSHENVSEGLKSWIFTPTHGRIQSGYINLTHNMVDPDSPETFKSYIHVLVVRPGQVEEYSRIWGSSHAIMELPSEMPEWNDDYGDECTAEACKVGYARKFIQAFAEEYKLDTIVMLDDLLPHFYEVETCKSNDGKEIIKRDADRIVLKHVPLYKVLKHLEDLYHDPTAEAPKKKTDYKPHEASSPNTVSSNCREAYTGPPKNYGVIGIRRLSAFTKTTAKRPFLNTHVVSLCVVNVKALKEKEVKYKPWEVWEDLHLNNQCNEKDLFVVKFNRFVLFKKSIPTWQPQVYIWNDDTRLDARMMSKTPENEIDPLLRYIGDNASPGRCEYPCLVEGEFPEMMSLVREIRTWERGKHHFAAVHPNSLEGYLRETVYLSLFEEHILLFPIAECIANGWTRLNDIWDCVIIPHFDPLKPGKEGEPGKVELTVLNSHNVEEFDVKLLLMHVRGKGKLKKILF